MKDLCAHFQVTLNNAHDARADSAALAQCVAEAWRRGVMLERGAREGERQTLIPTLIQPPMLDTWLARDSTTGHVTLVPESVEEPSAKQIRGRKRARGKGTE